MTLRLTITSRHREALGELSAKEFTPAGGTIGRSLQCDWVLPDAQRFLSSRHASIDFRSGSYYVVDTSMNGVYVNGSDRPVGRGKPQRLFSGDRIRIGDYEITAEVDEETGSLQVADEEHIDPVDLAQRVEAPAAAGEDLVDAFEMTGVGFEMELSEDELATLIPPSSNGDYVVIDFDGGETGHRDTRPATRSAPTPGESKPATSGGPSQTAAPKAKPPAAQTPPQAASTGTGAAAPTALPGGAKAVASPPSSAKRTAPAPTSRPAQRTNSAAAPGPATPPANASSTVPTRASVTAVADQTSSVLEPFFRGAGIRSQQLTDRQADAVLLCLGQMMRELIVGMTEVLHQRADQKQALRLPTTTIQPRGNNPLKFSAGVEETVVNLLLRDSKEYLIPVEAVRDAFSDIKHHQALLLRALRGAVDSFIGRLDPELLEQKFSHGRSGKLLGAANKLKYWDLYKDLYQLIASHPPEQMSMQFLDDFAHAYQAELARADETSTGTTAEAG